MTVVLALVAVVLVATNVVAVWMTGTFPSRGAMWSQALGFAVMGPALMASLFLIARSNRNWRRYLMAFCAMSALAGATTILDAVKASRPSPPQIVQATGSNATLAVPADWRTSDRKSRQAIYVVNRLSTEAVAVNSVPKREAPEDFKAFADTLLENQRALPSFQGAKGPDSCPTTAMRCQAYEVRNSSGSTLVVSLLYVVESRSAYHVIVASTNEPLLERARPRFEAIVASFRPGD